MKTTHWKTAAMLSFVFFFGYFLTSLYWISNSLFVEFDRWWWALPLSFAGLPLLLSLFPTFFIAIASYAPKFKSGAYILALIFADLARSHLFTGFPWNLPIHTWANTDLVMSVILPHSGFYIVNNLTIIALILPYFIVSNLRWRKALIICLIIFYSSLALYKAPIPKHQGTETNYTIALIQGNIAQKDKWDPEKIWNNFDHYITMSKDAIKGDKPHIIIWPETTISENLINTPRGNSIFKNFLSDLPKNSVLITGILNQKDSNPYNSIHVYDTQGTILHSYSKHHLVPFGEYMPFGLDTITGFSGFSSGDLPNPIYIEHLDFSFLPLICYESIFSHYSSLSDNSHIILNLTNDAWFGKTAGPYQHFDHIKFRASENEKTVIRLSGNGISGYVDSHGHVKKISQLNQQEFISFEKN